MAHRAYWKGFLRLSLVSIAVEVYTAVDTKSEISFRQIHKPSGRRINYTKTVEGAGEIPNTEIVKGYEIDHDRYVTLEPDELDALKLESRKTIDLVKFVDGGDIDPRYFERPYFLGPGDKIPPLVLEPPFTPRLHQPAGRIEASNCHVMRGSRWRIALLGGCRVNLVAVPSVH
jgi:non-homologous end joining protein Ku